MSIEAFNMSIEAFNKSTKAYSRLIDWFVFNANFSSISAIS
jgi:hypothetical protein